MTGLVAASRAVSLNVEDDLQELLAVADPPSIG